MDLNRTIKEFNNEALIIKGVDNRKVVSKWIFPYTCIGALIIYYQNGMRAYGTAFLVASDLAITVAHNFQMKDHQHIKFYPALNGVANQGIDVTHYKLKQQYLFEQAKTKMRQNSVEVVIDETYPNYQILKTCDYALIKLEKHVYLQKYIELDYGICQQNEKLNLMIFGYPADKVQDNQDGIPFLIQKGHKSFQYKCRKNMIHYKIDTTVGQSGSPILVDKNDKIVAIGIHKGSSDESKKQQIFNFGVLFNETNIKQILQWEMELRIGIKVHCSKKQEQMIAVQQIKQQKRIYPIQKKIEKQQQIVNLPTQNHQENIQIGQEKMEYKVEQKIVQNIDKFYMIKHSNQIEKQEQQQADKNQTQQEQKPSLKLKQLKQQQKDPPIKQERSLQPSYKDSMRSNSPQFNLFRWDTTTNSQNFIIKGKTVQKSSNKSCQITSQDSIPISNKITIIFKILQLSGNAYLNFGILSKKRKHSTFSNGQDINSIGIQIPSEEFMSGIISINGKRELEYSNDLVIPAGGHLKLEIDRNLSSISITNETNLKQFKYILASQFLNQQLYIYTSLETNGNKIQLFDLY